MSHFDATTLVNAALAARGKSYSPYSQFAVGAALLAQDGTVYTGANIENAAYSVSICAERVALACAVNAGARRFVAIAVAGGPAENTGAAPLPLCAPCGVCRQALYEFCDASLPILLAKSSTEYETYTLGQLLPVGFGPDTLG